MLVTFQRMNVVMSYLLIVCGLLLAGCAPAPKPTQEPMPLGDASQEAKITFADAPANPCATAERQRDQMLVNFEKLHEAFESLDRTNKQLEEILRKRNVEPEYRLVNSCPNVKRTDLGETIAPRDFPFKRIYYYGGTWCNVWADDKGMHWEKCK